MWALSACAPTPVDDPAPWTESPIDGNVLARRLSPLPSAEPAEVTCRGEDPFEVHRAAADGEVVLYGLLAGTTYRCTFSTGGVLTFTTDALPDDLPAWEVAGEAGWGEYTLFNHCTDRKGDRQAKLLVVDREGRLRWYHHVPYDAADLDAGYLGGGRFLYGGGYSAPPTVVDLAGETVSQAPEATTGGEYHHVAERIGTGEIAALATSPNTFGALAFSGAVLEVFDGDLAAVAWEWDTQQGIDAGWFPAPEPGDRDPYHLNAVAFVGDAVYASFRDLSRIVRFDRATGERTWTLGLGGDLALDDGGQFYGQHAPEIDGDRILLHDNGVGRPGGSSSRVLELEVDLAAGVARTVWEWTEPGWYEPVWGDVDRLPDGHVLVARPHCGACAGGGAGPTQLVEVDPATDEVVWRLSESEEDDAGYRAERIDGCALFANERYCSP